MPKIVDHDERRKAIAAAACAIIAEDGLEGTTLAKVARRCRLTTGAIAHYFADKDALLKAALRRSYQDQIARMDKRLSTSSYSLVEVLSEALPLTAGSRISMRVWLAFWGRAIGDTDTAKAQRSIQEEWAQRVEDELHRAISHGLLPESLDVAIEAEALIAQIRGLCIRALLEPNAWERERQIDFLRLYVERLSERPARAATPLMAPAGS